MSKGNIGIVNHTRGNIKKFLYKGYSWIDKHCTKCSASWEEGHIFWGQDSRHLCKKTDSRCVGLEYKFQVQLGSKNALFFAFLPFSIHEAYYTVKRTSEGKLSYKMLFH